TPLPWTLETGLRIVTGSQGGTIGTIGLNESLISAQTDATRISITGGSFTNQGTLQAINGATLAIQSQIWNNTGTINIDNGTLILGGRFSPSNLGLVYRNGGMITLAGTLNNASQVLTATSSTPWTISGGTIIGGMVSAGEPN